ncbi:MAG: TolC family protein, partial [Proteobacteria bacterium]|nr:TolC family protein [Pseudomonadota bacterium]
GRYQEGVGILLEVTDARASLTDALLSQVRAEYDYRISRVGLRRVLGTLVGPEANER